MNERYYKNIIRFMVMKEPDSDFAKMVSKVSVDVMTDLAMSAPGAHIYVPSAKTFSHWLCVQVIEDAFKSLDITSQDGKQKAKKIAGLFGLKNYQVKKILQVGKFTR